MRMNTNVPCTHCFSTLGVGSRMKIYRFLRGKDSSTVSAIVDVIGLAQPTVSYHLKEMREAGLLDSKKTGKEVYYSVAKRCPNSNAECILNALNIPQFKR